MFIWAFFIILSAFVLFVLFIPEIFPRCSCCRKLKFRPSMRIHKTISLKLGYGGNCSVCKSCCRKYNITCLKDLEQVKDIKRRLKLESIRNSLD
jgi:hypothetical protein